MRKGRRKKRKEKYRYFDRLVGKEDDDDDDDDDDSRGKKRKEKEIALFLSLLFPLRFSASSRYPRLFVQDEA